MARPYGAWPYVYELEFTIVTCFVQTAEFWSVDSFEDW